MQTEMPFYDCPEDALKAAVQALGGAKRVGSILWHDKDVDTAGRMVLDRLNPGRAEKFELSQVMCIFSLAKEKDCHAPYEWFSMQIGYKANPICPKVEEERLVTVIESAAATMDTAMKTLERMRRLRDMTGAA
jgi:hypothetical protein